MTPLPGCPLATYFARLGHARQPGRWTRETALVALGLYVREEHRLPPQRHLHNSEHLPSHDTVVRLFGTAQAYFAALPAAWATPLRQRKAFTQAPRHHVARGTVVTRLDCLQCDKPFNSPDKVNRRLCDLCLHQDTAEDGLWLTGRPIAMVGLLATDWWEGGDDDA